jgi:GAF domain-containing protein
MTEPHDAADEPFVRRVDDVTGALENLAEVLSQEEELEVILHRVCHQVIHAVPDAHMASVTLLRADGPETVAVTDVHANTVDEAQYRAGEGPCLEAAETEQIVRVAVPEAMERWPQFAEAAVRHGVASYLSAPLFIDSEYHGSLNLYGEQPHGFRRLDAALLALYTTAAEAALHSARRFLKARESTGQLSQALESRAVIDQAKGILMAMRSISAEDAFALLVKQSQRENVKVRDVAAQFVARSTKQSG